MNHNKPVPWSEREELVLRRHASTHTAREVGAMLGRSQHSVSARAARLGISFLKHGIHNKNTRHPDEKVRAALALQQQGVGAIEISKRLGVPASTVSQWINGYMRYTVTP